MKVPRSTPLFLTLLLALSSQIGCGQQQAKSPDVKDSVKQSLDQAGFKDVSVSEDRDKGVVTLGGTVKSDADKAQAEAVAKSAAAGLVIADEVGVRPPGNESDARSEQSDLDKGIEKNVDAALTKHKWNHAVSVSVKNGVVTLTGKVDSQAKRSQVEKVVSQTPNVNQVVNELEVSKQKATASS